MRTRGEAGQATRRHLPALGRALPLCGVLLALGGCTVGPKFTKPEVPVAEGWQKQEDARIARAAVESVWWKSFGDPALDRLVELAYQQNLPLQIAGLRIMEARAQLGIATGRKYPQLQVATGSALAVGLSENAANVQREGFDRHYVDYQLGFDAAWELDLWGKYRRGVEADAANLLASVADYDSALVSLTAEIARSYAVIRTFQVLMELARQNAAVQEEGLQIAESRFRNGATSELDVAQARTLLESTRASIPRLQIGMLQARNALSTLLGQPTGMLETLLAGAQEIPKVPATVAVGVPAEMLRRRPDVRAAELAAAAQCARVGIAETDLYPRFTLFGTLGAQTTSGAGVSFNPFSGDSLFYSLGPRIFWPFLNYGRIRNAIRVEDARFQQLLLGYHDTVLRAAQEVEDALTGFLSAQDGLVFEQRSVEAASRSVQIAVVQYREGSVDFQRVLDAQRSLLQQQNSLAQTQSDIATYLIALYKALGGGWELRRGKSFVPERVKAEMGERTNWGDLLSTPPAPEAKGNPAPEQH